MKVWRDILEAADALSTDERRNAFLASIVHVEGSSYGRPGSRLLVLPDGTFIGFISGGCLERDLANKAPHIARDGPAVVTYDTREGGDAADFNLGCDGVIHILLEPLARTSGDPLATLRRAIETDQVVDSAVVFRSPSGPPIGTRFDITTGQDWHRHAHAIADGGGGIIDVTDEKNQRFTVSIERIDPPPRLLVFGAGHDVPPLAQIASAAGFAVEVIDKRPGRAIAQRFPAARVACESPTDAVLRLDAMGQLHAGTAAVLMHHDLDDDAEAVAGLLGSGVGYIGLLGPKRRTGRLLAELTGRGVQLAAVDAERLHAPVGHDLGGRSPEEIAVAVVAELIAWRHGRPGGPLQQRLLPIHDQPTAIRVEPKVRK